MAGGLFGRVIHYLVNQLLVDSLANSLSFQRFAVRTSKKIEELKRLAAERSEQMAQQIKEASRNLEDGSLLYNYHKHHSSQETCKCTQSIRLCF